MSRRFDAIIIGAGQAGPPLAGWLTGAGMSVALIERHLFGGTCVNTGCLPTMTLIASAYAAHLSRRGADYGVMHDAPLRIEMARVKARSVAVSANARPGGERSLRGMEGCVVINGHASFFGTGYRPRRRRNPERAAHFINVGGRAVEPDLPGIDTVPFLNNGIMLALDRQPSPPRRG